MTLRENTPNPVGRQRQRRDVSRLWPWLVSFVVHVILIALTALVIWSAREAPGEAERYVISFEEPGGGTGGQQLRDKAIADAEEQETKRTSASHPFTTALKELAVVPLPDTDLLKYLTESAQTQPGQGDLGIPALGEGKGGPGTGFGTGTGPGFGRHIADLSRRGFDVVFVYDATKSMEPFIGEVKARIRDLVKVITHLVPGARVGLVAYKDYGDIPVRDGVPLTQKVEELQRFLDSVPISGGGDDPEAVKEGLSYAIRKNPWRRGARKIIIIFGDAPPHELEAKDTRNLARQFRRAGGIVSVIDARLASGQGEQGVMPAFQLLAEAGGGEALKMSQEAELVRYLLFLAFGSEWSYDLELVYERVLERELPGDQAP